MHAIQFSRIKSIRGLKGYYDKLLDHPNLLEYQIKQVLSDEGPFIRDSFPLTSPLTGLPPQWIPLTTIEEIVKESIEMRHCLASHYLSTIAKGEYFAYSLTTVSGIRATLGISLNQSGEYEFGQAQGKFNHNLPEHDINAIKHALESANLSFDGLTPQATG